MAVRVESGPSATDYARITIGTNAVPVPVISGSKFTVFCRIIVTDGAGPLGASIIKFDRIPPGFGGNLDYYNAIFYQDGGQIRFGTVASDFASDDTASSELKDLGTPYNVGFVWVDDNERRIVVEGVVEGENLVFSQPNGLEGIIVFTSYTSNEDNYNKPIGDVCIKDLTIWDNVALSHVELATLNDFNTDPRTLHPIAVVAYWPFVNAATIGDCFTGYGSDVACTVDEGGGTFSDQSACVFPDAPPDCPSEGNCPTSGVDLTYPPCVTKWTQCVRIVRRDDLTFRFTTLDRDFDFRGNSYLTCNSVITSAVQAFGDLTDVGSTELGGILAAGAVDEADLYGGLFDDAFVEIWRVPYEGLDEARRLGAGWVGKISQSARGYKMEVLGPGARLDQRPIVQAVTPQCRWVFGDDRCTIDISAMAIGGTVTSGTNRGTFLASIASEPIGTGTGEVASSGDLPAQYVDGRVLWLTGQNAGQVTETKSVDFLTGQIILWAQTAHVPQAGDTFDLMPGCAQDFATCLDIYDNGINFGGFPHVPGQDAIIKSPNVKPG